MCCRVVRAGSLLYMTAVALMTIVAGARSVAAETDAERLDAVLGAFSREYTSAFPAAFECNVTASPMEALLDRHMLVGPLRPEMRLCVQRDGEVRMKMEIPALRSTADGAMPDALQTLTSGQTEEWLSLFGQPLHPSFWPNLLHRLKASEPKITVFQVQMAGRAVHLLRFSEMEIPAHVAMRVLECKFWIDGAGLLLRGRFLVNTSPLPPEVPCEDYPQNARELVDLVFTFDFDYARLRSKEGADYRVVRRVTVRPGLDEESPTTATPWVFEFTKFRLVDESHAAPFKPEAVQPFPRVADRAPVSRAEEGDDGGAPDAVKMNELALEKLTKEPPPDSFCVAVMADPHGVYKALKPLMEQAAAYKPRFCMILGDLGGRWREERYKAYVEFIMQQPVPVISVPGNHDMHSKGRLYYRRYIGKDYFRFDYGPARFICLDTSLIRMGRKQLEWYEESLKTDKTKLVFTHCPPFVGDWWPHAFLQGGLEFLRITEAAKVDCVLAGHAHVYNRTRQNGTDFLLLGSAGPQPPPVPTGRTLRGFALIRVSPGNCSVEYIKAKDNVLVRWGVPRTNHRPEGY